ncbi:MAG: GNAT family N-acetyltransferase [Clostridiales bacterium]|jgi:ribosomal-protein-alanine N-acetyltransferase|nr:GNAT family N-acetyltransferase [Clostridiales bacterium]
MANMLKSIFRDPPVLQTNRLILRRMQRSDSSDMFAYAKDPAVTRFLTWEPHPDEAFTRRYLTYVSSRYKAGEFFDWALVLRTENKMIGTCGFTRIDCKNGLGEVGYVLNRNYWGQGLASEALQRVIQFAFDVLNLNRVESRFMEGNTPSRKVMEKSGMTFEGFSDEPLMTKGQSVAVGVCSITKDAYLHAETLSGLHLNNL